MEYYNILDTVALTPFILDVSPYFYWSRHVITQYIA